MKTYRHATLARFPSGYLLVAVEGDEVWGIMPDDRRVLTGWSSDEAHNFVIDGRWVEVR